MSLEAELIGTMEDFIQEKLAAVRDFFESGTKEVIKDLYNFDNIYVDE